MPPKRAAKTKSKRLTATQLDLLKTHAKHHSKEHIEEMKKQMRHHGKCFQDAHSAAQKSVGK